MESASASPQGDDRRAIVDQARQGWIRRLIDLSRRNNLLYFRELKTGTLEISCVKDAAITALLSGGAVDVRLLATAWDEVQTSAKVQEIRRRAQTNLEERGLSTLFVTFGAASWAAEDDGRPPRAPVFLLPVSIENRGREGRNPTLRAAGELQVNEVLLHVLEVEHGVGLGPDPLLPLIYTKEDKVDFGPAYEHLRNAAATVPGFLLDQDASFVGNFSYQKLAMVKDLQVGGDALCGHDLVAALAGHLGARQAVAAADHVSLEPRQLDSVPPEEEFLVLDADSSQHAVIAAVLSNRSGVIQGPPGTGKSQTIANLVAELAARGERVLFVAEKRAALEVVQRRLEATGLGHLALDLHGADVDRRKVMAKVAASLDLVRGAPSTDVASLHERFVWARKYLNEHVARLHAPRMPWGLSVYEMQGRLLRGAQWAAETRWRGPDLDKLDANAATAAQDLFREAAGLASLVLRMDPSPWTGAQLTDGAAVLDAIDRARRLANSSLPALAAATRAVVRDTGLHAPTTLDGAEVLAKLIESLALVLETYRSRLFEDDLDRLALSLAPARSWVSAFWAFCFKPAYRAALAHARSLKHREGKGRARRLLAEVIAARDLRKRWRALSRPDAKPSLPPDSERYRTAVGAVASDLQVLANRLVRNLATLDLGELSSLTSTLAADTTTPHRIPKVLEIERQLGKLGAESLLEEIRRRKPSPKGWPALFHQAWVASCLDRVRAEDPSLGGFSGETHTNVVEEFKRLDQERLRFAAARVLRGHAERTIAAMNAHPEQESLVRREAAKKTRHLPLRSLADKAGDVLSALHPCWMASPLSVSQLLPARQLFDIVLFDEASQVLPEDAVPSVMRARTTVVAGDEHQLPPTTFFVAGEDEEEEREAGAAEGFESILKVMSSFLSPWTLDWHYRSRDEALIAFANHHIYAGRLVTFPGPGGAPAVSHVLVSQPPDQDGQEDSSSSEVAKVVELVLRHADERPDQTLGVIAMGIIHANRVQGAVDQALRGRPELDGFFDQSKDERFFVKNLERVQGDERDAIILSIGYGKDRSGRLPYRFGPLLVDGGERRLNVAITRARRRMTLISSFSHLDMDPTRSKARGVDLLRLYLEYASSGGTHLGQPAGTGVQANPFEQDVYEALTARGLRLLSQWGASKYRIDLVAQHPKEPGRFVLAIECDGASYHAAYTARDRDRLRQQHLEALGWRFHRIWSTDWFMRRDEEIERALAAYTAAVAHAESGTPPFPDVVDPDPVPASPSARGRGPRPTIPRRAKIDDYSWSELVSLLRWVKSDGLLRTDDQLVDAMIAALKFVRRGRNIEAAIRRVIRFDNS